MIEPLLIADDGREELVDAARRYGYSDGVAVATNGLPDRDGLRGVVVDRPTPRSARDSAAGYRSRADLVYVRAESDLKTLVRDPGIDGLLGAASATHLDRGVVEAAAESGVAMVFDLSPVVEGRDRYRVMRRFNVNAERCREAGCPALLTAGASGPLGVRAPRELRALAVLSGFTGEQADEALDLPGRLLDG